MSTSDDEGLVKPFATTLQEVAGGKAATRASYTAVVERIDEGIDQPILYGTPA